MIDYIAVDERIRIRVDVIDAKVVRGALEGSDHHAVVVYIMLRDKWEFCRKSGKEKRNMKCCATGAIYWFLKSFTVNCII